MAKRKRSCLQNSYAGVRFPLAPQFLGDVPERLIGLVLKTSIVARLSEVRILSSPQCFLSEKKSLEKIIKKLFFFF